MPLPNCCTPLFLGGVVAIVKGADGSEAAKDLSAAPPPTHETDIMRTARHIRKRPNRDV